MGLGIRRTLVSLFAKPASEVIQPDIRRTVDEVLSDLLGREAIEVVRTLKPKPGVYRMLDTRGDVLYVGKARSLKARVANYTQLKGLSNRLQRMISQTRRMEARQVAQTKNGLPAKQAI